MISFYILKGISHETLIKLTPYEKAFYRVTMNNYIEQMNSLMDK